LRLWGIDVLQADGLPRIVRVVDVSVWGVCITSRLDGLVDAQCEVPLRPSQLFSQPVVILSINDGAKLGKLRA
jgi:hypothetical protein